MTDKVENTVKYFVMKYGEQAKDVIDEIIRFKPTSMNDKFQPTEDYLGNNETERFLLRVKNKL